MGFEKQQLVTSVSELSAADLRDKLPFLDFVGPTMGRGGQKVVRKCVINGSPYALKIVPLAILQGDGTVLGSDRDLEVETRRLQRELMILNKCPSDHLISLGPIEPRIEHIARILFLYYVEEWIAGQDLAQIITESGPLSCSDTATVGIHIGSAIEAIWSHNKIHRDIKPKNIMRKEDGQFVLLDLGIAFDLDDISLTAEGNMVGTPGYVAPERLLGRARTERDLDFRCDLFCLGIVLYECATGVHPFMTNNISAREMNDRICEMRPADPLARRPDMNRTLSDIIMRLLRKQPHLRYKSCSMFIDALKSINLGGHNQ